MPHVNEMMDMESESMQESESTMPENIPIPKPGK